MCLPFWEFLDGACATETAAPMATAKKEPRINCEDRERIEGRQKRNRSWPLGVGLPFRRGRVDIELARLSVCIKEGRLATFDNLEGAANGRAEIFRVGDGSLRVHAQALREFGEVDGRVLNRCADFGSIDTTAMAIGHDLHLHN